MHTHFLERALLLATHGRWAPPPNPSVGCVIASEQGIVLGEGFTQLAGGPHAEIMALRNARERGNSVEGATAYVTLEPCSHTGRTGPCCDALIEAGIKRLICTQPDPNPLVGGKGLARLRSAGIEVTVLASQDPLAQQSRELNIGFFSRMLRKMPWVRLKVASSLDGMTALSNGTSQWITSEEARRDGHAWRARASCVLTGVGTVLQDRPRLDVRMVATVRQPDVVIVDSHLQTPLDAPVLMPGRQCYIYTTSSDLHKANALRDRGAIVIQESSAPSSDEVTRKVDLRAMLQDLARREVNEIHVEAGHKLNGSLIREGLVDEMLIYMAPKIVGQGMPMTTLGPIAALTDALELEYLETQMVGPDLRIRARQRGRGDF